MPNCDLQDAMFGAEISAQFFEQLCVLKSLNQDTGLQIQLGRVLSLFGLPRFLCGTLRSRAVRQQEQTTAKITIKIPRNQHELGRMEFSVGTRDNHAVGLSEHCALVSASCFRSYFCLPKYSQSNVNSLPPFVPLKLLNTIPSRGSSSILRMLFWTLPGYAMSDPLPMSFFRGRECASGLLACDRCVADIAPRPANDAPRNQELTSRMWHRLV
jgi:hypothetical protein